MMEFLNFTFASFWHFAGIVVLIAAIASGVADFIRALFVRSGWSLVEPKLRQTVVDGIREERSKRP